jgi:head-tail adaptor
MGFIASDTGIAGKRHSVAVFAPSAPFPDGDGGYTETIAPLDPPTWSVAIDTAVTGSERQVGSSVQASITHVIRGDWRPDITTRTQCVFNGRRFYLRSVTDDQEARRGLRCLAEEDVSVREQGRVTHADTVAN